MIKGDHGQTNTSDTPQLIIMSCNYYADHILFIHILIDTYFHVYRLN